MAKRILYITTDMMRWNSLGFTGCDYVNTPVLDSLAEEGITYQNAYNQNPLCMPSRNVMLTGQYPRTNGSWNNGITLIKGDPEFSSLARSRFGASCVYKIAVISLFLYEALPGGCP